MDNTRRRLPEGTNIEVDEQGRYQWRGTIDMNTNPTIAKHLAMVMAVVLVGVLGLIVGLGLYCRFDADDWLVMLSIYAGASVVVCFITALVYSHYKNSLYNTYAADYIMDENGVTFRPAPEVQAVNRNIAADTFTMASAAGRPGAALANDLIMNADAVSEFALVNRVVGIRNECCIKVNQPFLYNQVYVAPVDYDFVYHFITSHCPKAECTEA